MCTMATNWLQRPLCDGSEQNIEINFLCITSLPYLFFLGHVTSEGIDMIMPSLSLLSMVIHSGSCQPKNIPPILKYILDVAFILLAIVIYLADRFLSTD